MNYLYVVHILIYTPIRANAFLVCMYKYVTTCPNMYMEHVYM